MKIILVRFYLTNTLILYIIKSGEGVTWLKTNAGKRSQGLRSTHERAFSHFKIEKGEHIMDATIISDLISNVGFPIAVVIYMFWSQNKEREQHKQETDGFIAAINNNTVALTKLADKIGE